MRANKYDRTLPPPAKPPRLYFAQVMLVKNDGSPPAIVTIEEAYTYSDGLELDLVCVNPAGQPPVVKALDVGKQRYEEKKKKNAAKKKAVVVELKEIKFRPKTDEGDLSHKLQSARKFIDEGNKVKLTCRFRGREVQFPDVAQRQLEQVIQAMTDIAKVEVTPRMDGRTMTAIVAPVKKA